ncbi:MAG: hypothetical protein JWL96_1481, partial [Sphingomonas bacterium]
MRHRVFMRLRAAVALGAILLVCHGAEAVARAKSKPKTHKVAPKKAKKKVVARVVAPVPVVVAVPVAPPAPLPPPPPPADDAYLYRWIDEADALAGLFGGSAPDFSFRYDGGEDWAWRASDGHMMIVEPVGDQRREYYYVADSDRPFLVRDGYFSYGFTADRLAVVFDADGRAIAWEADGLRDLTARRLFQRGVALHRA